MPQTRRTTLQVLEDTIGQLKLLEAKKDKLEKELEANGDKPIHWALIRAIAEIGLRIAIIVRAIRKRRRRS